jgi:hypothetical protein
MVPSLSNATIPTGMLPSLSNATTLTLFKGHQLSSVSRLQTDLQGHVQHSVCTDGRDSLVTDHYCLYHRPDQFYFIPPERLTVRTNYHPLAMLTI